MKTKAMLLSLLGLICLIFCALLFYNWQAAPGLMAKYNSQSKKKAEEPQLLLDEQYADIPATERKFHISLTKAKEQLSYYHANDTVTIHIKKSDFDQELSLFTNRPAVL